MRIVFTCGGTGGHIYPAIAIADSLKQLAPGADIEFIGSRERLEWDLIPKHGYRIRPIPCGPIHRPVSSVKNIKSLALQGLGLLTGESVIPAPAPAHSPKKNEGTSREARPARADIC